MAQYFLFFSLIIISLSYSDCTQQSFRPKALVLPVSKDASTLQFLTQINQRTPLVPIKVVLDLGGQFLWVDCDNNYVSTSYRSPKCRSAQCSLARASSCGDCNSTPKPGCNNNTCSVLPDNSVTGTATIGEVAEDVVLVKSTNGSNPGQTVSVPRFLFSCAPTFLLKGLASGVVAMAGLGRTKIALPSQFSSAFSFSRKFAICLASSNSSDGVVFFGDGSYTFLPGIDFSHSLTYTPLFINPVSTASAFLNGEPSAEYFIGIKSIKIMDKALSINTTLLSIDSKGNGGTKISTVNPYTVLEHSIYKVFIAAFILESEALNITRVTSIAPFSVCYDSNSVFGTRLGPNVPSIDLVLQNKHVVWSIYGSNSMVQVSNDVMCLGFVDGGSNPTTSIVLGAYQLENNLLEFDLATSKLGFSSTLLGSRTTCSNFNFASN